MATEEVRVRLRRKLEASYGAEEASYLMDRPPGGWNDLVTNQMLDAKLAALEHKLIATMERGFRAQTWRLSILVVTTVIPSFGLFAALVRFS